MKSNGRHLSGFMKLSCLFALALLLANCTTARQTNSPTAVGDDAGWSKVEHGLRGRLIVLAPKGPESPFCEIFLELQEVQDLMGQVNIRFAPQKLYLQITDKDGKGLARAGGSYDGFSPDWKPILLPGSGTIRFKISFPGLGYRPNIDKVIVDLGPDKAWIVPQTDDFFLSGTFSVAKEPGDHPVLDWSGTITFPKVKIPKGK